jgi:cell division protein FtsB
MTPGVPDFETRGSYLRPRWLSNRPSRGVRLLAGGIVLLAGLWLLLGSDAGIVRVLLLQQRTQELDRRIGTLSRRRADLRERLDRIANDEGTFERVARESYGLSRRNEIVFLLPGHGDGPSWRNAPPPTDLAVPAPLEAEDMPLDTAEERQ